MHTLQRQLQTDHNHMQRLLECLSHEIDCYDFDSKRSPDLAIILSALDYIHVYIDKWHHPTEDVIFNRLQKKHTDASDVIEQLKSEHEAMIEETNKILELFNSVAEDCIVPAHDLVGGSRHFISKQKQHMSKENKLIYPLMDKSFSDNEWHEIEEEVKLLNDPLFDKPSKKEYDHLYRYILELEKNKND